MKKEILLERGKRMIKGVTLKQNIEWLLNQYKKELELEKNSKDPNYDIINDYENVITELEFALEISK